MKSKICVFLLFFLLLNELLTAQTKDFGVWTTAGAEKNLGKWSFGTETELRTKTSGDGINRWSLKLETAYKIAKPVKFGIGYQFIYFHDIEYSDYQPRQRYFLFLQAKQEFGDFTITLKEQSQRTIKDERDRIKENGEYDTYKINPEWCWRNRIKVAYNTPGFPINPSFSFETFYQLNNPDGNTFDNLRYTLSLEYKLKKHHIFELYGLINKEINVSNPAINYVAGLGYTYTF
jgi:hypothetical protein